MVDGVTSAKINCRPNANAAGKIRDSNLDGPGPNHRLYLILVISI